MEQFKLCPSCGERNSPILVECQKCGTDLESVALTTEKAEEEKAKRQQERLTAQTTVRTEQPKMFESTPSLHIRVCECGHKNPANLRKCEMCGEDISDLPRIAPKKEETPISIVLKSHDGFCSYSLKTDKTVLGRENVLEDYLKDKSYVSREHCCLYCENGRVYVENRSQTNLTYVNNVRVRERVELKNGDELGLGGMSVDGDYQKLAAYFFVEIS